MNDLVELDLEGDNIDHRTILYIVVYKYDRPAYITERIMPGVVNVSQGAWYDPDEEGVDHGGCANVLTRDGRSPGGALAMNTALVQVEPAPQSNKGGAR